MDKENFFMSNLEKYNNVFIECFEIEESKLNQDLVYSSIPEWDSIGHMGLIAEIEELFDIMMETDDVIDFSSYEIGINIIKKYGVEI